MVVAVNNIGCVGTGKSNSGGGAADSNDHDNATKDKQGDDDAEDEPSDPYHCWNIFRSTLWDIVGKGPGTPVEFSIFRPSMSNGDSSSADKSAQGAGRELLAPPNQVTISSGDQPDAQLDSLRTTVPQSSPTISPATFDGVATKATDGGCIFVRDRRLSRAQGVGLYCRIQYISLEKANLATGGDGDGDGNGNGGNGDNAHQPQPIPTGIPTPIFGGLPLPGGELHPLSQSHKPDNRTIRQNSVEPDSPGLPVSVTQVDDSDLVDEQQKEAKPIPLLLEYPCTVKALVRHMTSPDFDDKDGQFVTTFFFTCWCVSLVFVAVWDIIDETVLRSINCAPIFHSTYQPQTVTKLRLRA